jgi:hypothetical protein
MNFPTKVICQIWQPNPNKGQPCDKTVHYSGIDQHDRKLMPEPRCLHGFFVEQDGESSSVNGLTEKADGSFETVWHGYIKLVEPTIPITTLPTLSPGIAARS